MVSSEYQSTWCELYNDAWTCSCYVASSDVSFEYPASTAAAEVCPNALELCTGGALELAGAKECSPSYQSASQDWCDAQHDCTGAATIDGIEVQVHEWLYTSCYTEVEGEWTCECGLGAESTSFELSSDDAWTTCQDASATCVETLAAE